MVEGLSRREAAKRFGVHRNTITKMLSFSVPPGYRRRARPPSKKLGPHMAWIDAILEGDSEVHKKQRHTAHRIFERLRAAIGRGRGARRAISALPVRASSPRFQSALPVRASSPRFQSALPVRASSPRFQGENLDRNLALVDAIKTIADAKGVTVAQIAIAWALSRGHDIVPLVGARRRDRLAESLGALAVTLSTDDLAALDRAVPKGAAAGTRYAEAQMAHLDSERG
jgi:Aldo/keto reductase family